MICDLTCRFPTSNVNGEDSKKSEVAFIWGPCLMFHSDSPNNCTRGVLKLPLVSGIISWHCALQLHRLATKIPVPIAVINWGLATCGKRLIGTDFLKHLNISSPLSAFGRSSPAFSRFEAEFPKSCQMDLIGHYCSFPSTCSIDEWVETGSFTQIFFCTSACWTQALATTPSSKFWLPREGLCCYRLLIGDNGLPVTGWKARCCWAALLKPIFNYLIVSRFIHVCEVAGGSGGGIKQNN